FRVPEFFDAAFCRRIRAAMDCGAAEPAEVIGRTRMARQRGVRRALQIEVAPDVLRAAGRRLDDWREAIGGYFGMPLEGREGCSFLRYPPGGFYRPHRDRAVLASWP